MMSRYTITQEEFKVISELKKRFGDVSLAALYNQSMIIDAKGNPIPRMPLLSVEEACKTLTDKQIEELLHEKIGNMCIYAHYDLAEHQAGLISPHYNGEKVEFIMFDGFTKFIGDYTEPNIGAEPKRIKSALESMNHEIKLVATAVKTVRAADWVGYGEYTFSPVYDHKSLNVCGNVIFLDKQTGKFHAMPAWVCNQPSKDERYANGWGLNQFMSNATETPYFQNKVLTQISDTLRHARVSQSLQR